MVHCLHRAGKHGHDKLNPGQAVYARLVSQLANTCYCSPQSFGPFITTSIRNRETCVSNITSFPCCLPPDAQWPLPLCSLIKNAKTLMRIRRVQAPWRTLDWSDEQHGQCSGPRHPQEYTTYESYYISSLH